jgi:ribonuclease P protein component
LNPSSTNSASITPGNDFVSYSRNNRLLRHADFERVYKQGRRHFASLMTVFYLRSEVAGGLRVGFTVSRALGGAVDRNRMKRRLREAVRQNFPGDAVAVDVVINPKKSLLKAEFSDISREVGRAFDVVRKSLNQVSAKS